MMNARFGPEYYRKLYRLNPLQRILGYKPGVLGILSSRRKKGRLLDIGCGVGLFLRQARARYETFGCDVSTYAACQASGFSRGGVIVSDAGMGLAFKDNVFDIVTAFDVVEHMDEPAHLFKEAMRLLRPDGIFVFSSPNPCSFGKTIKGKRWAGNRDATHVSIKTPQEWLKISAKYFRVRKVLYDGLWDAPYLNPVWFREKRLMGLFLNLPQTLLLTVPSYMLSFLGCGSPRFAGENVYIFCNKRGQDVVRATL